MTFAHGRFSSYTHHKCRCKECSRAAFRAAKEWRLRILKHGGSTLTPALGAIRRIQALVAIGWSLRLIAERTGIGYSELRNFVYTPRTRTSVERAAVIAKVFDDLCMTVGPSKMSVTLAGKHGWAPPLAWDDIDDPDESPQGIAGVHGSGSRLAEILDFIDTGYSLDEIAERLEVQRESIARRLRRSGYAHLVRKGEAA